MICHLFILYFIFLSNEHINKEWIGLPDGEVISDKIKNDVCKLKDEDLAKIAVAPGWEIIGPEFYTFIADCDVLIAHNGKKYDIPLLLSLEKRVNLSHPNTFPITLSAIVSSVLDTIEMLDDGRIPWDLRFGGRPTYTSGLYAGKPNRKLSVNYACTHDGADIENAHQAGYDVDMMLSLMDKIDDSIGSIKKSHISEPIQTFGFIYDLATACHAIPSPGDDIVGAENLVIYYHKQIMESQAISDLCRHDISPLMPHINHVNTDDIPMVTSNYTPPIALMQFFALVICISTLSKGQSQEEKDELYKAFHRYSIINPTWLLHPMMGDGAPTSKGGYLRSRWKSKSILYRGCYSTAEAKWDKRCIIIATHTAPLQ